MKLVSRLSHSEKIEFYGLLQVNLIASNPTYYPGVILRAKNPEAFREIFLEVRQLVATNSAN